MGRENKEGEEERERDPSLSRLSDWKGSREG